MKRTRRPELTGITQLITGNQGFITPPPNHPHLSSIYNPEGILVSTADFSYEAKQFQKFGYYTPDLPGTPGFANYWDEQTRRCTEGYSVGGVRITGEMYGYLNWGRIKLTRESKPSENIAKEAIVKSKGGKKIVTFPDFWDGDYEYFWVKEIADVGITPEEFKNLRLDVKINHLDGGKHLFILKARRKGYSQPLDEVVQTPSGPKYMGEIKVGDLVIGSSGKPIKVLEIHPQGSLPVWQVTLRDGRKVRCSGDHLWTVTDFKGNRRTYSTERLSQVKLVKNVGQSNQYYHWHIQNTEAVEYPEADLPIDPYTMGVYLGDGSYPPGVGKSGYVQITSIDQEIIDRVKFKCHRQIGIQHKFTDPDATAIIRDLGLQKLAGHKHIPEQYLLASIEQRMELLRGLMDTDGSSSAPGNCSFVTTSHQLSKDIERLLAGLGIRFHTADGKTHLYESSFAISPSWVTCVTTDKPIFHLERKLKNIRFDRKYSFNKIPIVAIEKLDYDAPQQCITVDSPDNLYLTTDYVVTHNSYKNGWIVANRYNFTRDSISLIGAQQKSFLFPEGTMGMANNYLNFLNATTAWAKRRLIDKQDHIKSGFLEMNDGIPVERGYKSQIMAISFKDNPDAARGKDATLILLEEAGKFSNLEDSYNATKPTVEDGIYTTGQILVFGTGGKDNDDWADFAKMHGNPEAYNALAFQNQWDEGCENQLCGYFVPDFQNKVGFIDKDGNSDKVGAKNYELDRRMKLAAVSTDKSAITQHTIEYPFTPREATALISGNIFGAAIADLKAHKGFLESSRDGNKVGKNVEFIINQQGKVECQVDLGNKLSPCPYPLKQNSDETGCWVIWEEPEPNPPYGLYVSGTDPYNVDKSTESVSLGSTIILKRAMIGYDNHDKIVAEYTGRPQTAQDYYESVRRGLSYYNAICLYENNFNGMKMHFQHQNSLHLLARTPTILKSNANTSIASNYGLRMTDTLKGGIKDELEMYTKDWLMTSVGDGKLNLHSIYSIPILNELITYNSEGNFDRIISLMLAICQKFQLHSVVAKKKEEMIQDPFFHRKFFQ